MFNFFIGLGQIGGGKDQGFGAWANPGNFPSATALLESILSKVIAFLTIIGGIWFIFQFIVGTYGWMSSAGNKESLKNAQDRIVHAITGLLILVAAYAIISVIGMILGLDILNPGQGLQTITK